MKSLTSSIRLAVLTLSAASVICIGAQAQQDQAKGNPQSHKVEVSPSKGWVDTTIDVRSGAKLRFTASGQITYPADQSYGGKLRTAGTFGPDGLPRGFADLVHQYAVGSAGHGALIGRIGSESYAQAFLVGTSKECDVPVSGRLYLGINPERTRRIRRDRWLRGQGRDFEKRVRAMLGLWEDRLRPEWQASRTDLLSSRFLAPRLRSRQKPRRHGQCADCGDAGPDGASIHGRGMGTSRQNGWQHGIERIGWISRKKRLSDDADEHAVLVRPCPGLWIRARRAGQSRDVAESPCACGSRLT